LLIKIVDVDSVILYLAIIKKMAMLNLLLRSVK